jgi:hypothetical protein
MALGPVEILAIEFKGNRFNGAILPELLDLVNRGIIRIIDLVVVSKDAAGTVTSLEVHELAPDHVLAAHPLISQLASLEIRRRLIGMQDIEAVGAKLDLNCTGAVMLFEHAWAAHFKQALLEANGRLVLQARIPDDALEAAPNTEAAPPRPAGQKESDQRAGSGAAPQVYEPPRLATSGSPDMMAQLQQLAQMHEAGILTDEEFSAAKQKLLLAA